MNDRKIQLGDIDLNLLVALHALIETESVTKAAAQVGITQSAMSHILRRLRDMFDDEVLVRGPGGMVCTPRAESMREALYQGLLAVQDIVRCRDEFLPAESTREFRICASDYMQGLFMPVLINILAEEAPHVRLRIMAMSDGGMLPALISGDLDLSFGGILIKPPPQIMRRLVLEDYMLCAVRRDHPRIRERLTLEDYTQYSHILVSPLGKSGGTVDEALAKIQRKRHVALRVQTFLTAPWMLMSSDYILTAPARILSMYAKILDIAIFKPPIEMAKVPISILWNQRDHDDPAMRWLREIIVRACQGTKVDCKING